MDCKMDTKINAAATVTVVPVRAGDRSGELTISWSIYSTFQPGRLLREVLGADPTGRRPRGRPRTCLI